MYKCQISLPLSAHVNFQGISTMKPSSLYETIDNRVHPITPVTPGVGSKFPSKSFRFLQMRLQY